MTFSQNNKSWGMCMCLPWLFLPKSLLGLIILMNWYKWYVVSRQFLNISYYGIKNRYFSDFPNVSLLRKRFYSYVDKLSGVFFLEWLDMIKLFLVAFSIKPTKRCTSTGYYKYIYGKPVRKIVSIRKQFYLISN